MLQSVDFTALGLDKKIIEGLAAENITIPTKVQQEISLRWKEGGNFFVQSETGSGKTLAYLLPMFQCLLDEKKEMRFVVLVPTHELVMQVYRQVQRLSENSSVPAEAVTLVGNVNIARQIERKSHRSL